MRYGLIASFAAAKISGVKSMSSFSLAPCKSYGGGFVGNGCVGEVHSPGTSDFGTRRSRIGQIGLPVTRSNVYANACFVSCTTIFLPFGKSARIGADGLSQSQMSWWMIWYCHFILP